MGLSDPEIIQKLKDGDKSVFDYIFRNYYIQLVAYSRKFISDIDEAEEIVQDLFVNFWGKRTKLDVNTSVKSYLFRSVHNMCLNKIKHKTVKSKFEEYYERYNSAFVSDSSDKLDEQELLKEISKAIDKMPEKIRVTFNLIRIEQMKYKEAAQKLGISVKTVEAQMGAALKHMRQYLKEYITYLILVFVQFL